VLLESRNHVSALSGGCARLAWSLLAVAIALVVAGDTPAEAQVACIPRQHHAWGRFHPGSWAQVRKISEEFDEQGKLTSVSTTETKTTLVEVRNTGCTLRVEVTVEVGGRRVTAQPRMVVLGYMGQGSGERAIIRTRGTKTLTVGGKSIPCQVLEVTINRSAEKTLSTFYYSDSQPPFVLKRQTRSTDPEGNVEHSRTSMDVIAVDMPYRVLAEVKTVAFLRTVKTHPGGSIHTLEVYCADVPGGVVAHSSKELDAKGRIIRRNTLELVDYGVVDRRRGLGRGRWFFRRGRLTGDSNAPKP